MRAISPEIQQLHNIHRNAIWQFVGLDYIIYFNIKKMRDLPTKTSNLTTGNTVEQIKIEDPYFIPKSPVFTIPIPVTTTSASSTQNIIEYLFNLGEISRSLFQSIRSIDDVVAGYDPIPAGDIDEKELLDRIKLYIDYTAAIFIQQLLSFVLLYPETLLSYMKLDDKARQDTIRTRAKLVRNDLFNYELEVVTDTIMLLMNSLGLSVGEGELASLLGDVDKEGKRKWSSLLEDEKYTAQKVKENARLIEIFQKFSNMMEPDLISGIPRKDVKTYSRDKHQINDLLRVTLDLHMMNVIGQVWKELFKTTGSPSVIMFLRNEITKIIGYFETARSAPGMEVHISISLDRIVQYLESVLAENIESKLVNLSNQPSSEDALNIYRSLQIGNGTEGNLPRTGILNFLFTANWILQDTPVLADLHERAEEFIEGWNISGTTVTPVSHRLQPINLCSQIFTGIVSKVATDTTSEKLALELFYNSSRQRASEVTKLLRTPGGLNEFLIKARGVPL
jgi:hypothetical protein